MIQISPGALCIAKDAKFLHADNDCAGSQADLSSLNTTEDMGSHIAVHMELELYQR